MDSLSKTTRSRCMAAVKSRGNKSTERKLARLLRHQKLKGWRTHYPIEGTPDFCWPKIKVALFVDGCFWHGCPLCYIAPKSNVEFWIKKLQKSRSHDRAVTFHLRRKGWRVLRVWECSLSDARTITRIQSCVLPRR